MSFLGRKLMRSVYSLSWQSSYIGGALSSVQYANMKNFPVPPNYKGIEIPELRQKLKLLDKVPKYPPSIQPMKMTRQRKLIRGEEEVHNNLLYNQYGIVALRGGFLRHTHIEMIRLTISRNIDVKRMFTIWRIDSPWKPVTKKSPGKALGCGKGNISHYVTPIKAGRIIIEMGGRCSFEEAHKILLKISRRLPFDAKVVSAESLENDRQEEICLEKENTNPYTLKYIFQNNFLGCHNWLKDIDRQYLGKYSRNPV